MMAAIINWIGVSMHQKKKLKKQKKTDRSDNYGVGDFSAYEVTGFRSKNDFE